MKIAVTAQGQDEQAAVDPRFGRARWFVVVDTDGGEATAVDNSVNLNATQGAGVQAAKTVADLGVAAVITGHVGPKAFSALRAAGVRVFTGAAGTVAQAVRQFQDGALSEAAEADTET